jgi:SpoVK/Ycf46/Vps4 family AAA+-type ATPase
MLHIDVELEPDGSGTIKLAGPFKRGFLGGPPDIMELETPCTVLIENIDFLQKMFGTEEHAGSVIENSGRPMHGRSLKAEMTAYLKALLRKPGVFLIATAATFETLKEPLRSIIGNAEKIVIAAPNNPERLDVWQRFADDHRSLAELDLMELAQLSEGVSRHDIVMAGHDAVDKAYRESLKSGEITNVGLGEVLSGLAGMLDHDSEAYRRLEDAAVAQLYQDLEQGQLW